MQKSKRARVVLIDVGLASPSTGEPSRPRPGVLGAAAGRWARKAAYLDGGFGKIEGGGQLAAPRPRHVVLAVKFLLQAGDLLPGEGGAVAAHLVGPRRRAAQRAAAVQAADAGGGGGGGGGGAGRRAALRVACGVRARW